MKKTTNINEVIREIKEYQDMQKALNDEIEKLKAEAIQYLNENEIDEYMSEAGKVTYREVISNRFASTEFKKVHADLYKAFTKKDFQHEIHLQLGYRGWEPRFLTVCI